MNIVVLGLSYHKTPLSIRERVFFRKENLSQALRILKEYEYIDECVILSTCNRTEIYIVTNNIDNGGKVVEKFLLNYHGIEREELRAYLYEKKDKEAIEHLIKVSCSLESMVLGEQQILGQVKEAYQLALEWKTTNFVFNNLFQKSINIAKKVRTQTNIGEGALSLSYAAAELSKRIFSDLTDKKVMIIGTGKMGEFLIKSLKENGVKELKVVNRNIEKAKALAKKFNGEAIGIDQLYEVMPEVDIIITSTSSPHYVIKVDNIKYVRDKRKNKPIFLIDIGVPRNIDPIINSLEGAILYNIDDLEVVVKANRERRLKEAELAEKIIQEEIPEINSWYHSLEIMPIIHGIKKNISEICRKEILKIDRFLDEKKLDKCVDVIANKILALPMSRVKEQIKAGDGYVYIKTLKELFHIERKNDK